MARTKLQEIKSMYAWLKSQHTKNDERYPQNHIRWDYSYIKDLVNRRGCDLAKRKMYHSVVLSLDYDRPYFYVLCDDGEDEYGRGDYNHASVKVNDARWNKATENFVHNLLTQTIMKYVEPIAREEILANYKSEILNHANRLMYDTRKNKLTSVNK